MVHRLHKEMVSLVRRFMGRFVPPHLIADVPLKDVTFKDPSLQLPNADIFLGGDTQQFLEDNMDDLSSSLPQIFE